MGGGRGKGWGRSLRGRGGEERGGMGWGRSQEGGGGMREWQEWGGHGIARQCQVLLLVRNKRPQPRIARSRLNSGYLEGRSVERIPPPGS